MAKRTTKTKGKKAKVQRGAARRAPAKNVKKARKPARKVARRTRVAVPAPGANQPSLQPVLTVPDVREALLHYGALGAREILTTPGPRGSVGYAILQVGTSFLHVAPTWMTTDPREREAVEKGPRGTGVAIYSMVDDVDGAFRAVKDAGFEVEGEPQDMFWGDRVFGATDRFGYRWLIAEHVRDVPPEEMAEAAKAMAQPMGG